MDKIEELIDHFAGAVEAYAIDDYWVLRENRKEARVALRAEFDAQALRIAELEKEVHDVSVYLNKNHAPVVDWNLKPGYAAIELLKKFYSEKADLQSELATLKDAQRWIPVGERLPKVDNYVSDRVEVCYIGYKGKIFVSEICCGYLPKDWTVNGWTYIAGWYPPNSGVPIDENVTHWRPLPQPPESE